MNDILQAIMDADTALKRAIELAERGDVVPVWNWVGESVYFTCLCGGSLAYGDKYCRNCGGKLTWENGGNHNA